MTVKKNRNKFSKRINVALRMLHEKTTQKLALEPGSIERLFHHCRSFSSFSHPASHSWHFNILAGNNHSQTNTCKQSFHHKCLQTSQPSSIKRSDQFKVPSPFSSKTQPEDQISSGNTKERSLYCIYIQYLIAAPDTSPVSRWRTLDGDRQEVVRILKHEVYTNKTNTVNWNDSKRRNQRIIKQSVLLPEMNKK